MRPGYGVKALKLQIGMMILNTSISIDDFTPYELSFPHLTAPFIDWHKPVGRSYRPEVLFRNEASAEEIFVLWIYN